MTVWECLEGLESLRDPPSLDPSSSPAIAVMGGPISSMSTTSKKVRPSKASLLYLPVSRLLIFEEDESATFPKRPTLLTSCTCF